MGNDKCFTIIIYSLKIQGLTLDSCKDINIAGKLKKSRLGIFYF
jgi:hypothetical protein